MHPNPTTGIFNVTITRNNAPVDIKEVAVYDMMGRTVWKNTNGGTNSFSIDITDYSAGIYYIRSINIFGEPEIQKFIKN